MFKIHMLKSFTHFANLYLCQLQTTEMEGWGGPEAACSSAQTFQCSLWAGLSHTCALEKPGQSCVPENTSRWKLLYDRQTQAHKVIQQFRCESHLLFLVWAEIQKDMQVLKLPRGPFDDELLQSRHAQIHTRLKQRMQSAECMCRESRHKLSFCQDTYLIFTVTSYYFQSWFCYNGSLKY